MKRIILALSIVIIGCATKTYQIGLHFIADNFEYEVIGIKELRLVCCNDTSSVVNIPTKITHNGLTYKITAIGFEAFANKSNMTTVAIPKSVKSINTLAFHNCVNLTNFTIPKAVKHIESTAFHNTAFYNNKDNWTDNVLYKDGCLLSADTLLSGEYSIHKTTRLIASEAFSCCKKLISITIPRSITTIRTGTFAGCESLKSITIPISVKNIEDNVFVGCSSLTSVELPNEIDWIAPYIFKDCSSLESITIPDNVNCIEVCAFENCKNLKQVVIGSNVDTIVAFAFLNCNNLKTITCLAKEPPTLEIEVFPNPNDITLLVPKGCKDKYINSDWNKYFNGRIKEME